ncbi:MAG: hypothetical protein PVF17_04160 [Ignavibacteria bacterium]
MKLLQKLILPLLVLVVIVIVYFIYFKSDDRLGLFSEFDVNNSAVKDIRVQIVLEKGINNNIFYARDRAGEEVLINADELPAGFESASIVILKGHLNKDSFHAHSVLLDN